MKPPRPLRHVVKKMLPEPRPPRDEYLTPRLNRRVTDAIGFHWYWRADSDNDDE
jgi:hypothetical protein